jgi:hypothetical protein
MTGWAAIEHLRLESTRIRTTILTKPDLMRYARAWLATASPWHHLLIRRLTSGTTSEHD